MYNDRYLGMLQVEEVLGPVGNGVTNPLFCIINDGGSNLNAVVKTRNNNSGNSALINEFIGYKIAEKLDMTIPEYGLCEISPSTVMSKDCCLDYNQFGLGFFSKRIGNAFVINNPRHFTRLTNKDEFLKVICLDYILANKDRNRGNLLVDTKASCFYTIDFSHITCLGTLWIDEHCKLIPDYYYEYDYSFYDDENSSNKYIYDLYLENNRIDSNEVYNVKDFITERITSEFIDYIASEVPDSWIDNKECFEYYVLYIKDRFINVNKILENVSNIKRR